VSQAVTTVVLGPRSVLSTAGQVVFTPNAFGNQTGYVLPGASEAEPGTNVSAALFSDLTDDERDELLEYLAWYRARRRTSRGAAGTV